MHIPSSPACGVLTFSLPAQIFCYTPSYALFAIPAPLCAGRKGSNISGGLMQQHTLCHRLYSYLHSLTAFSPRLPCVSCLFLFSFPFRSLNSTLPWGRLETLHRIFDRYEFLRPCLIFSPQRTLCNSGNLHRHKKACHIPGRLLPSYTCLCPPTLHQQGLMRHNSNHPSPVRLPMCPCRYPAD